MLSRILFLSFSFDCLRALSFLILCGGFSLASVASGDAGPAPKTGTKIALTQIVQHPSLDLIAEGIREVLKEGGYDDSMIVDFNAQGNVVTAVQIAQKIAQIPGLVLAIAITTPSAQPLQKALQGTDIPLVFAGVTDPVGAKLVKSLEAPNGMITGTVDLPKAHDQALLMKKLMPDLKTVGFMYNPSESNAVFQVTEIKKVLDENSILYVDAPTIKSGDVQMGGAFLVKKVDAIFIPNDNTLVSALSSLLKVTNRAGIPVFVSDPESVGKGALAAFAHQQKEIGRETGKMAVRILKGEKPSRIPVKVAEGGCIYLNQAVMKKGFKGVVAASSFLPKDNNASSQKEMKPCIKVLFQN